MADLPDDCNTQPSLKAILSVVSVQFGISESDLKSARRDRVTACARQCFYLLAQELTHKSLGPIARAIGGRDHSTLIQGAERARERLGTDPGYAELYRACVRDLGGRP